MTAVEILPPGTGPHDERWHELRRQGVTASEIAAVMGLSKWASPFSLFWQKTYAWTTEGNEHMAAGRHLEPAIADWWEAAHGQPYVMCPAGLYAHPDRPWQLATPDRLLHGTCYCCADGHCSCGFGGNCSECYNTGTDGPAIALLEVKWLAHSWDGWGEPGTDQVPVHYRAQVLWQADVMGVDEVHIAALGPGGFRAYTIHLDDTARADLEVMRAAGEEFHRRLVEGDAPDLDSHTATLDTLKRIYPDVGEGDVECTPDLAEEYRKARADKKAAEQRIDACEALIRARLGNTYSRVTCGGKSVASRSVYERKGYYVEPTTIDKLNPGRADSYA